MPPTESVATILVADDNEANRLLAQSTLEDEGYRVVLAHGGVQAVELFEREPPDCALLDIRMPDMDGFAVCERMRAHPRGSDTPILFLTALRDVDTFDRALEAGASDFLMKPVRPTELLVRVESALKLRRVSVELREQYDLLKRQRDDLLRLQLQKERLMAFVVHDLKNPVNAMGLHAQVLLRNRALPEGARDSAAQIQTEARHLNRMILNLLDLAKADEGKLSPNRASVDLTSLFGQVSAELEISAVGRKVTLSTRVDSGPVSADEDLLRRTLANLVENAIRHAPPNSTVLLTAEPRDDGTLLRVVDAGSGIPPELRERVFDPFVQVEAGGHPMSRGGRGLGLSFCKLSVEAHGGRIWIEDGKPGTVFCVHLPHGT